MKRQQYTATLHTYDGEMISTATATAWNSAIRASERLAREWARSHGVVLEGAKPVFSVGISYSRDWVCPTAHLIATACPGVAK